MTLADRVWARVDTTGDCWEWTGHRNWAGYGVISDGSRRFYVHRVAFESELGPIPPRACVLHSCDNRICVRPFHLRLGTRLDNSADMVARNRSGKGEAHSQAVLTEAQVRAIRACVDAGLSQAEVASRFGVSRSMVGLICQRLRWTHVA